MAHTLDHLAAERREELTASRWAGLREFVTTEQPTWEEFGRSGEPFFYDPDAPVSTRAPVRASGIEVPMYPVFSLGDLARQWGAGSRADDPPQLPDGAAWGRFWGGQATPVVDLENGNGLTPEDPPEGAIPAGFEWLSNLPGEFGEAGGEFFTNLFGPPLQTLAGVPGSLLGNIPTWVPLLGAAYLLTRK